MQPFNNLNSQDKQKIDHKLAELHTNTGKKWEYAIVQQPEFHPHPYLEIIVDGRTARPIALEELGDRPADSICTALDRFFEQTASAT